MSVKELTLETISELDGGKVSIAWQEMLKRIVEDCEGRPGELGTREVRLIFRAKPIMDSDGLCEDIATQFHIEGKMPKQQSRVYTLGVRKGGRVAFSDVSKDGTPTMFDDSSDDE